MNADESRVGVPVGVGHDREHEVPVELHHPDAGDQTLLAAWLRRAMADPARFWGLLTLLVVGALALSVAATGVGSGRGVSGEAWTKLEAAKTPAERVEVARDFPGTTAERWALLQAATEYYNQGFNDLPANRDAALPILKKALDLFQRVAKESPADAPQARSAALGAARTLEARNELDKAVRQYQAVAANKAWAGTDEARTADRQARALQTPEALAFYKDLYDYKRSEVALPPGGVGDIKFPSTSTGPAADLTLPSTLSDIFGPKTTGGASPEPNPLLVPPPPPVSANPVPQPDAPKAETTKPETPAPVETPKPEMPKPGAPKPETPKPEAPTVTPTPEPIRPAAPGLPSEVFTPAPQPAPSPGLPSEVFTPGPK